MSIREETKTIDRHLRENLETWEITPLGSYYDEENYRVNRKDYSVVLEFRKSLFWGTIDLHLRTGGGPDIALSSAELKLLKKTCKSIVQYIRTSKLQTEQRALEKIANSLSKG